MDNTDNCANGKCGLKNQTSDKVFDFMKSQGMSFNEQKGFGLFLLNNTSENKNLYKDKFHLSIIIDANRRKDILKNITYNEYVEFLNTFDNCIGSKFIPYGYDKNLDEDIKE